MNSWRTLKLTECLEKSPRAAKIPRKKFKGSGRFPIVSQEKGLVNGYWDDENDAITVDRPIIIYGDHTQVVKLVDFDFVVGADGVRLLKPKSFLNPEYLYYFLLGNPVKALGYARHFRLLKDIDVTIPSLPEQKRIVAILDEAFAGIATAIANTEKNLANARGLFESYLNSVISQRAEGWVVRTFNDICSIPSKLVDPRDLEFNEMRHVGAGNIVSMTGELIGVQTAKEEGLKSGKFLFDQTMVLYSKIRPYLMKVARPDFSGLCSADIYPLAPETGLLDRGFLYYLLLSKHFTDFAVAGSARVGMPKVNREHLFSYTTAMPGVEQQKSLVEGLDSVANESKRLESICRQKLNALTDLKQSLLQKAFSGELTTAPQDELETALA